VVDGAAAAEGVSFEQIPWYLLRERDKIFGGDFSRQVRDICSGKMLEQLSESV
jgi:hypothetical protein